MSELSVNVPHAPADLSTILQMCPDQKSMAHLKDAILKRLCTIVRAQLYDIPEKAKLLTLKRPVVAREKGWIGEARRFLGQ